MRITLGEMKSHKICLILSFVCMFMGLCLFSNHVSAASISRQGGATKTAAVTLEYGNADGYWSTITSSTKEQWYKFTTPYDSEGYTTIKFDNLSIM